MSKKSRPPRGAGGRKPSAADPTAIYDKLLSDMWATIEAGDPLRAEVQIATCTALPRVGQMEPGKIDDFGAKVLVNQAIDRWGPEGTALLRLLMAVGSPRVRQAAGAALAEMTSVGIYPPDWVNQVGKAVPVQAMRRYDVFGDDEVVAVTFRYGEAEHCIAAQVDLTGIPVVRGIVLVYDAPGMFEALSREEDPVERSEPIGLADARRRLEEPLARCDEGPDDDLSVQTLACLPIARSRIRRLPADAPEIPRFTAADRTAAVDEFLKSPLAAEAVAGDEEATRFWAEVLTGYSGRVPGGPPAQVGPRKLARILLEHVPATVVLSGAQRRHIEPAVTAWVRWSAEYRELDDAAAERLAERLPQILAGFDAAYGAR